MARSMLVRYDQDTKAKAVRLVREHAGDYPSEYAAISAVAGRLGMSAETLRKWIRHAEVDRLAAGAPVDHELVVGSGEADLQAFDLVEPAFALGLGDAGDQVVADLGDAVALVGGRPVHAAAQATVLVNTWGSEGA